MNTYNEIGDTRHREGKIARRIEHQTSKIPSDVFLWAAGAVVVGSMVLQIAGMREGIYDFAGPRSLLRGKRAPLATFIGQWAPTILLLGLYNKIVKVAGSDDVLP